MKFICFLFCLGITYGYAQVPDYLGNSPEWRIEQQIDWFYPCVPTHNYTSYVAGDTIIDTYIYKKIRKHGKTTKMYYEMPPIGDPSFDCFGTVYFNEFQGYVRQDSLKFYVRFDGTAEQLMYDFDLHIGDVTPVTYIPQSGGWNVTSQDSIFVNGDYYKRFYLNNGSIDSTFIIQGIGSRAGLFESFHGFFESDANLLCYAQASITYFPVLGQSCDFDLSVEAQTNDNNWSLFPNPTTNKLTVKLADPGAYIQMVDAMGRTLNQWENCPSEFEISMESLRSGVYYFTVVLERSTQTFKVVKE